MANKKAGKKKANAGESKSQNEPEAKARFSAGSYAADSSGKKVILAASLFLLVFAAFSPVLRNGFVNYDDPTYVIENFHVQSTWTWQSVEWAFRSRAGANWHPLTWLSHMVDFQIFGLRPWGHHLTNLLLHAINTCLLFLVLRRMTRATWRSWFVSVLFGLHPQHVESVAWVAERKDVLSTLFWLLALYGYARYAQEQGEPFRSRRVGFYFLSLFFFICALMSKPMVVTFPCVLLLLDYWPLNRVEKNRLWSLLLEKLPFFLLTVASSAITISVQRAGEAVAPIAELPLAGRLENAAVSYISYLGKLFFPVNLAVFYPYPSQWPLEVVIFAILFLLGVSVFAIAMRRQQPYLSVGWLRFIGTLVPVIGLVQAGSQAMADRYSYVPSIGVFIFLTWGLYKLTEGWQGQNVLLSSIAVVAITLCAGLTWRQAGYWRNGGSLFGHAIAVTKNNLIAYSNLARYEVEKGRVDEAINTCREALKLEPDFAPINEALGVALSKNGHLEEGIMTIQLSILAAPDSAQAHGDLADAFLKAGRTEDAMNEYRRAIWLYPDFLTAYDRLGVILENTGRFDEAIKLFEKATLLYPAYADAHNGLALALAYKGRVDDATREYQRALILAPKSFKTHFSLAILLEGQGQIDGAMSQLRNALELDPDSAQAHNELGGLLGRQGRLDEAISQFREAVRLKPDYAKARQNLELAVRMKNGRTNGGNGSPKP